MMIFFDLVGGCCSSNAAVVGHAVGDGTDGVVIKMSVMGEGTEVVVVVERLMLEFCSVWLIVLIVVLEEMFSFI
jgi:hypothetical protein